MKKLDRWGNEKKGIQRRGKRKEKKCHII